MSGSSFRCLDPQVFDRNWDALSFYHPNVARRIRHALKIEHDEQSPEPVHIPPLEGLQDVLIGGKDTVIAVTQDGTHAEIVGPQWNRTPRQGSRNAIAQSPPQILFILSGGDLSFLEDCRNLIDFEQRAIVVVEHRVLLFLAALAARDRCDLLSHPNLFLCVGDDYEQQLRQLSQENAFELVPPARITAVAGAGFAFPDDQERYVSMIRALLADLAGRHRDFVMKHQDFLRNLSSTRRFHAPPRIWGYAVAPAKMVYSIHREILETLFEGFRSAGWDARLLLESRERWTTRNRILRDIALFDPDVYFFLNSVSNQFFEALFGSVLQDSVVKRPRIVYLADEFAFSPIGSAEGLGEWDHVFAIDPEYQRRLSNRNLASLHYLPAAASVKEPGAFKTEFDHAVSFVGSVVDLSAVIISLPPTERDWLEERIERAQQGKFLSDIIPDDAAAISPRLISFCRDYATNVRKPFLRGSRAVMYLLSVEANTRKRIKTLASLLSYGVAIYGPEDWVTLLPASREESYRGPLPFDQVPSLFASSSINLNLHSLQCPTALNPRDFDILASGGFLMSDYVTEADAGLIVDGRDAVFFRGLEDLHKQVEYYLSHEKERIEIAQQGHRTAVPQHSLLNRARQILETFG